MNGHRAFAELVAALVTPDGPAGGARSLNGLATACARTSNWGHTSIALRRHGHASAAQGGSSTKADAAADVEQRTGQGPTWDALAGDRPVFVPDLSQDGRWPQATPELAAAGIGAVTSIPLAVGAIALGAVTFYDDRARNLEGELDTLLGLAEALTHVLLGLQAQAADGRPAVPLDAAVDLRAVVHQATGMVAIQLGCGLGEALLRLRAHAYTHERSLTEVAEAVVGRALRLEP